MTINDCEKIAINKFKACKEYDYKTSFEVGKSVWYLARIFPKKYERTNSMTAYEVFASATNYGLAIELLLKTIISGESGKKPDTIHDLYKLFKKIDKDIQDVICNQYDCNIEGKKIPELFFRGVTSENAEEKFKKSTSRCKERKKDVKSLLKNNNEIFIKFRYMAEVARTEEVVYGCYEYGYFDVLCEVLINVIQERINM